MNITEIVDSIISGSVDLSELSNSADIKSISEFIAERQKQIADYEAAANDVPWRETDEYKSAVATAKTQVIVEAKVGCGNIIDNAFVVGSDKEKLDDDELELNFAVEFRSDPDEGEQMVTLREYPQRIRGTGERGDYRILNLRNKAGQCWTCLIPEAELLQTVQEIDFENNGFISKSSLEHLTAKTVLSLLGRSWFRVYCATLDNGRTKTYFSQKKFSKFLYARAMNAEKRELAQPEVPKAKTWEF